MYAVLIVLVAFGMLNTMLMSVLERTHEFGILLAGFNLPAGPDGSEFEGLFTNAADGRILGLSNALFARLAWYF